MKGALYGRKGQSCVRLLARLLAWLAPDRDWTWIHPEVR